jgi:hypothetical protein
LAKKLYLISIWFWQVLFSLFLNFIWFLDSMLSHVQDFRDDSDV